MWTISIFARSPLLFACLLDGMRWTIEWNLQMFRSVPSQCHWKASKLSFVMQWERDRVDHMIIAFMLNYFWRVTVIRTIFWGYFFEWFIAPFLENDLNRVSRAYMFVCYHKLNEVDRNLHALHLDSEMFKWNAIEMHLHNELKTRVKCILTDSACLRDLN